MKCSRVVTLCHDNLKTDQPRKEKYIYFIPFGVRGKKNPRKSAKRCCREGARQRQLATGYRTLFCAERTYIIRAYPCQLSTN